MVHTIVYYLEYSRLFIHIESFFNFRPLYQLSIDTREYIALTPGNVLVATALEPDLSKHGDPDGVENIALSYSKDANVSKLKKFIGE